MNLHSVGESRSLSRLPSWLTLATPYELSFGISHHSLLSCQIQYKLFVHGLVFGVMTLVIVSIPA